MPPCFPQTAVQSSSYSVYKNVDSGKHVMIFSRDSALGWLIHHKISCTDIKR
jgi:hypothetical protein